MKTTIDALEAVDGRMMITDDDTRISDEDCWGIDPQRHRMRHLAATRERCDVAVREHRRQIHGGEVRSHRVTGIFRLESGGTYATFVLRCVSVPRVIRRIR